MNDKKRIKESINTWNKIANSFDKTRKKPWDICLDYIYSFDNNSILADIACGNGRHIIPASKHFKKIYGMDISNYLLSIIKKKINKKNITNISLIQSDAVNIPIKNKSIDAIIFIAALHNIKDRENRIQSLKEIKRIMKKNGSALISVWSQEQEKFRNFFEEKKKNIIQEEELGDIEIFWRQDKLNIPRFYHLYQENEFKEDITKAGLLIERFESVKISSKKYSDNYFAFVK